MLSNQLRDVEEYAYHLEQSQNYMENQIVWESRQENLKSPKPNALIFYGPWRNLNELPRYLYNKDLFLLKCGNTEENSKNEKRFMDLEELSKFYDATLKKLRPQDNESIRKKDHEVSKASRVDEKMGVICEWKTNSTDDEALVIINP
ncbi:hypothetical protein Tco_1440254 [Tanacetum coccineum]